MSDIYFFEMFCFMTCIHGTCDIVRKVRTQSVSTRTIGSGCTIMIHITPIAAAGEGSHEK